MNIDYFFIAVLEFTERGFLAFSTLGFIVRVSYRIFWPVDTLKGIKGGQVSNPRVPAILQLILGSWIRGRMGTVTLRIEGKVRDRLNFQ
jgi:hypothetical protein